MAGVQTLLFKSDSNVFEITTTILFVLKYTTLISICIACCEEILCYLNTPSIVLYDFILHGCGLYIPNSSLQCYYAGDCDTVARLPFSASGCGLSGFSVILQSWSFKLKLILCVCCMASPYGNKLETIWILFTPCQQSINTVHLCCCHTNYTL